jgi:RNA polymerase sigma-70 factor (ECF subfamily)
MTARERFEALYAAHAGAVLAFARRRATADVADDVLSDVFLVVWRRLEDVPADSRPWLLGIAGRSLANQSRSENRRAALRKRLAGLAPEISQGGSEISQGGSEDLHGERVLSALQTLREKDREALLLTAWEGLTNREAARTLGIPARTFNVRLHRARRRLGRALEHDFNPSETAEATNPTPTLEAQ